MVKRKPRKFVKWSPSAMGTIYFDEGGNMYVYEEPKGVLVGLSPAVKGKIVRVQGKMGEVI